MVQRAASTVSSAIKKVAKEVREHPIATIAAIAATIVGGVLLGAGGAIFGAILGMVIFAFAKCGPEEGLKALGELIKGLSGHY